MEEKIVQIQTCVNNVKYIEMKSNVQQKEMQLLTNITDTFVMPYFDKLSESVEDYFEERIYYDFFGQNGYEKEKVAYKSGKYIVLESTYDSIKGIISRGEENRDSGIRGHLIGINKDGQFIMCNYWTQVRNYTMNYTGADVDVTFTEVTPDKLLEKMSFEKFWPIICEKLKGKGLACENPNEEIKILKRRLEFFDRMNEALKEFKASYTKEK